LGITTVNAVNGVATFTGLSIEELGVRYTLTATSPNLARTTSSYFSIMNFGAAPLSVMAGESGWRSEQVKETQRAWECLAAAWWPSGLEYR
jgi:hypothetical protein